MKRAALALTMIVLLATGASLPPSQVLALSVTDLGKVTNDVANVPLGNFHHIKTSLRSGLKPELLFVGCQLCDNVEGERWSVIKALDQFGSFSGVTVWPNLSKNPSYPTFPAFNMSHAVYRSRYVAFVNKDLMDAYTHRDQRLNSEELNLFNKYGTPFPGPDPYASLLKTPNGGCCSGNGLPDSNKQVPLVVVGGYAQTFPTEPLHESDFTKNDIVVTPTACTGNARCLTGGAGQVASFSEVQQSLITGKPANGLDQELLYGINAETNILITLICHADGKKPKSVCNRVVIRKLLKHMK